MFLEEIKIPLPSCMRLLLAGVLLVSSSDSGVGTSVRHTNGQRLTTFHGEAAGI